VAAAATTRTGHVAVIATAGTVESRAYPEAIGEANPALTVLQQACPDLVPLVEAGVHDGPAAEAAVRRYLEPLFAGDHDLDTLLLGCTHYPLLRDAITTTVGPAVSVVDSAFTTALAVEDLLDALGTRATSGDPPTHRVATTGEVDAFIAVARRLFGDRLPAVEAVDLGQAATAAVD
jgi:glutamate racemase